MQLAVMMLSMGAYLVLPGNGAVQEVAWVAFRIFSAMAVTTMLPFVREWFPRVWYGRIFGLLFTGFQAGYLVCSFYWGGLLARGRLHWAVPFVHCTIGFALLLAAAAAWLHERPPRLPLEPKKREWRLGGGAGEVETDAAPSQESLGALMHKVGTRWVFWAMVIACAAHSPAVEYSTHVTSYLKEMATSTGPAKGGFVCLQSALCEGRYRGYVFSYISALLLGSWFYDQASQLDRAILVLLLYALNVWCWLMLALAEPDAPAPAWVKQAAQTGGGNLLRRLSRHLLLSTRAGAEAAGDAAPILSMSGPTKTALASVAGATIALPTSLPFAIFSLDFGKEGAAVVGSLLQVVGAASSLTFLKLFPTILRRRGWFGVHATLASLSTAAGETPPPPRHRRSMRARPPQMCAMGQSWRANWPDVALAGR